MYLWFIETLYICKYLTNCWLFFFFNLAPHWNAHAQNNFFIVVSSRLLKKCQQQQTHIFYYSMKNKNVIWVLLFKQNWNFQLYAVPLRCVNYLYI